MLKKILKTILLLCLVLQVSKVSAAPILVQGQSMVEMQFIADQLEDRKLTNVGPFLFYEGSIKGKSVVVSKTLPGAANAAVATYIAIQRYQPSLVINQGLAAGYLASLNLYDIVVGESVSNLNAFTTPMRSKGRGSNSLEWQPTMLSQEVKSGELVAIPADARAVELAMSIQQEYKRAKVVKGRLASSDTANHEYDRLQMFAQKYGMWAEEQEGFAVAQICSSLGTPFVPVRIVATNIINNTGFQAGAGVACQAYVLKIIELYN